jgi:hypothetical protein
MKIVWVSTLLFLSGPCFAQDFGPSQLRLWAQIGRAQYPFTGLYTGRVDGRPNNKAGSRPAQRISSLTRLIQRIARRSTLLVRMRIRIGRRAFAARVGDLATPTAKTKDCPSGVL